MISTSYALVVHSIQNWYRHLPEGMRHFGAEVALGLAVGVISGIYSGLVVTRMARFDALKNELKRLILGIDFMEEPEGVRFNVQKDPGDFTSISADFAALGHSKACEAALKLSSEILASVGRNRRTFIE